MRYLPYFLLAVMLSISLTPVVRFVAQKYGFMDIPKPPRNLHSKAVAKLGGIAVFVSVSLCMIVLWLAGGIDFNIIPIKFIVAIIISSAVLVIGGVIDDKYNLSAKYLWIAPVLASLIIVASGIGVGIKFLSNPFGEPISLEFMLFGLPGSGIVIFLWLLGMMFTTKFLDGLDGLVAGIGIIAGLTLFALSLTSQVHQPITAQLAIILVGALGGYLIYAFHPASIFLGESGSILVGFLLGVLAVILGGKIATALLVMGIPILDVAWVIAQRLWYRKSPFIGDRMHLHFKLLDIGFSQKQTVFILYSISAVFGFTAVFLQSMGKLVALLVLFGVMLVLILSVIYTLRRKQRKLVG